MCFFGWKWRFFRFFVKLAYVTYNGQYRFSKGFPGPKESIPGQKSYFRPLYDEISKNEKSHFFSIFCDFSEIYECDSWPGSADIGRMHVGGKKMYSLDFLDVISYPKRVKTTICSQSIYILKYVDFWIFFNFSKICHF